MHMAVWCCSPLLFCLALLSFEVSSTHWVPTPGVSFTCYTAVAKLYSQLYYYILLANPRVIWCWDIWCWVIWCWDIWCWDIWCWVIWCWDIWAKKRPYIVAMAPFDQVPPFFSFLINAVFSPQFVAAIPDWWIWVRKRGRLACFTLSDWNVEYHLFWSEL